VSSILSAQSAVLALPAPSVKRAEQQPPVPPVVRQSEQASQQAPKPVNDSGAGRSQGGSGGAATAATTAQGNPSQLQTQSQAPTPGQASTGFVTQRLSQETVGQGLHIEPWRTALSSYSAAAALPAAAKSTQSVTV
jgi:hypothetical protein